jgi:putative zinc finger/helix-turn-helix YgiT family protein
VRTKDVCSECGAETTVVRGTYPFKEVGLNVVLVGVEISKCPKCNNQEPIIPQMNDLMRTIAFAVVGKKSRLLGAEVKFLRKYLHMTGEEFSRILHVDKTTLSKWENNEDKVGAQSDLLVRSVALALGDGLADKANQYVRDFERIQKSRKPVKVNVNPATNEYQYA